MTGRLPKRLTTLLILVGLIASGCGGPASPGASTTATGGVPASAGTGAVVVGPVAVLPPAVDPATAIPRALATQEVDDRSRARTLAGFSREVGSGWNALSATVDDAIDAAAKAIGDELDIDLPIAGRDRRVASVADPIHIDPPAPASAAAAMAIVAAALTAGQSLGQGGTREKSSSETRATTDGDDVATVTVRMKATISSTESRVVAEFTFELTGSVRNTATGGAAQMTGSATARVEIDGCPDESGSSKGRMSLSSTETVSGQKDGGEGIVGWTRDLSGDFDIAVDDEANISGVVLDARAQESVKSSKREPREDDAETRDYELAIESHLEFASGPGFTGLAPNEAAGRVTVTDVNGATEDDLRPLLKSATFAISVAAFSLGRDAEAFWRDGKCVEVTVDPDGGEVDPDAVADVVATVKHRFEADELDSPVEATLTGVAAIEPAGQKQPAPATVKYTAGSRDGDVGDVKFKAVSNRGIGEKTVKFTVGDRTLKVSINGKMTTSLGAISYITTVSVPEVRLSRDADGTYVGSGPATATIAIGIPDCPKPYRQKGTMKLRATRDVGQDPTSARDWTITWDSSTQFTTTGTCVGVSLESFTGTGDTGPTAGFMDVMGSVVFPQEGGTKHVQLTKAIGPSTNVLDATVTAEVVTGSVP